MNRINYVTAAAVICCVVARHGFTIRLKRLEPRAPDFGVPEILGVRTISSIFIDNYTCIFVLFQRMLFYY